MIFDFSYFALRAPIIVFEDESWRLSCFALEYSLAI
tara:strand:+ start:560 stop:667 length:108 start_codon:yes stop_codon:yes gene_type:complete